MTGELKLLINGKKNSISHIYLQIKSSNPDVIAFQEVRCGDSQNENQILELQKLIPAYKWSFFKCSNKVQKIKHSIKKGYNKEGL